MLPGSPLWFCALCTAAFSAALANELPISRTDLDASVDGYFDDFVIADASHDRHRRHETKHPSYCKKRLRHLHHRDLKVSFPTENDFPRGYQALPSHPEHLLKLERLNQKQQIIEKLKLKKLFLANQSQNPLPESRHRKTIQHFETLNEFFDHGFAQQRFQERALTATRGVILGAIGGSLLTKKLVINGKKILRKKSLLTGILLRRSRSANWLQEQLRQTLREGIHVVQHTLSHPPKVLRKKISGTSERISASTGFHLLNPSDEKDDDDDLDEWKPKDNKPKDKIIYYFKSHPINSTESTKLINEILKNQSCLRPIPVTLPAPTRQWRPDLPVDSTVANPAADVGNSIEMTSKSRSFVKSNQLASSLSVGHVLAASSSAENRSKLTTSFDSPVMDHPTSSNRFHTIKQKEPSEPDSSDDGNKTHNSSINDEQFASFVDDTPANSSSNSYTMPADNTTDLTAAGHHSVDSDEATVKTQLSPISSRGHSLTAEESNAVQPVNHLSNSDAFSEASPFFAKVVTNEENYRKPKVDNFGPISEDHRQSWPESGHLAMNDAVTDETTSTTTTIVFSEKSSIRENSGFHVVNENETDIGRNRKNADLFFFDCGHDFSGHKSRHDGDRLG